MPSSEVKYVIRKIEAKDHGFNLTGTDSNWSWEYIAASGFQYDSEIVHTRYADEAMQFDTIQEAEDYRTVLHVEMDGFEYGEYMSVEVNLITEGLKGSPPIKAAPTPEFPWLI